LVRPEGLEPSRPEGHWVDHLPNVSAQKIT
jgi:hypothetical protein